MSHKDQIDHYLYAHLNTQADKFLTPQEKSLIKPYQALYNFIIKGYLTVADLFNEMKASNTKFVNSAIIKEELFGALKGEAGKAIDPSVHKQVMEAISNLHGLIDAQFYDIADLVKPKEEPVAEAPAAEQ